MQDLAGLHCVLAGIEGIGAGLRGSFILGTSVVNYVDGRNGAQFEEPDLLCIDVLQKLGLPPVELPVRQQPQTGPAVWTVQRLHYFYRLTGFLRDMPVLLEALHMLGFIGTPGASTGWPDAPEYAAIVLAPELAGVMDHLAWLDRDHTRRISLSNLGGNLAGIAREFDADALEMVLQMVDAITEEARDVFKLNDAP